MIKFYYYKKICLLLLIVFALIILPKNSFAMKNLIGDINNDDKITAADAREVLKQSTKGTNLSISKFIKYDIDGNGNISASDARLLLRKSVGLEDKEKYANYTIYDQTVYTNKYMGNGETIKESGCSVSCMSIVLSKFGKTKEPYDIVNGGPLTLTEIKDKFVGMNYEASCSSIWYSPDKKIKDSAKDNIKTTLKEGGAVIALVRKGKDDNATRYISGDGSHYIVIAKYNSDGTVIIIDPNGGLVRYDKLNNLVDNYIYTNAVDPNHEGGYVCIKGKNGTYKVSGHVK